MIAGGTVRLPLQRSRRGEAVALVPRSWDTFKARSRYGLDSERNGRVGRDGGRVLKSFESCKSCESGKQEGLHRPLRLRSQSERRRAECPADT